MYPATLNNVIVANIPTKLLSPVLTLVLSALFTDVLTVLSTFDDVLELACNSAIAFSNVTFALSTSTCEAFGFSNTTFASFNAFVNPSNDAFV